LPALSTWWAIEIVSPFCGPTFGSAIVDDPMSSSRSPAASSLTTEYIVWTFLALLQPVSASCSAVCTTGAAARSGGTEVPAGAPVGTADGSAPVELVGAARVILTTGGACAGATCGAESSAVSTLTPSAASDVVRSVVVSSAGVFFLREKSPIRRA